MRAKDAGPQHLATDHLSSTSKSLTMHNQNIFSLLGVEYHYSV
jgi:hypothetical protein